MNGAWGSCEMYGSGMKKDRDERAVHGSADVTSGRAWATVWVRRCDVGTCVASAWVRMCDVRTCVGECVGPQV